MSLRSARRRGSPDIIWPGFVDALSSLLLVIIFLLSIFALAQFFLGQALSGRDEALAKLRATVSELSTALEMQRQENAGLEERIDELTATLSATRGERDALQASLDSVKEELAASQNRLADMTAARDAAEEAIAELEKRYKASQEDLERQRQMTRASREQIMQLQLNIASLRKEISRLGAALDAAEAREKEQEAVIADLGRRLNRALAAKVEELAGYRSEFFGRLRELLGARKDIRIEGDRFVFQSELLFDSGSAALGAQGRDQMRKVAQALQSITRTLPQDLDWILRIDGHTDKRPISTPEFANNWELSTARAISVVQFLISEGVPDDRLAATGFAEHQPIARGDDPESLRRNRRIEIRFTQR